MIKNLRVIGIGELKIDEIYKKTDDALKLLKKDGGGTTWNVLSNLGAFKIPTMAIGACGNDEDGDICINSLKKFNVDIRNIIKVKGKTKKVYITIPDGKLEDESTISSLIPPSTGEKQDIKYNDVWVNQINIPKSIEGIAVIDNLKHINEIIIDKLKNENDLKIVLDIGHIGFIKFMEQNKIIDFLGKVDFLQVNETVTKHLLEKFNLTEKELFEKFDLEIMILTKGSKGVKFIWRQNDETKSKEFNIETPVKIVDSCGAGDAFLSNFIMNYINVMKRREKIDKKFFEKVFLMGIKLTSRVVSCIGARGHLDNAQFTIDNV